MTPDHKRNGEADTNRVDTIKSIPSDSIRPISSIERYPTAQADAKRTIKKNARSAGWHQAAVSHTPHASENIAVTIHNRNGIERQTDRESEMPAADFVLQIFQQIGKLVL